MSTEVVIQNVLIPLGMMAMVVLIVLFSHVTRRRARARQAEIIRLLIEKFSSGEAFAEAIQGPGGAHLANALSLDRDKPRKRAWTGVFIPASILSLLSIGLFVLAAVEDAGLLVPAVVIGAVGFALGLSTYLLWRVEERDRRVAARGGGGSESSNARWNPDRP